MKLKENVAVIEGEYDSEFRIASDNLEEYLSESTKKIMAIGIAPKFVSKVHPKFFKIFNRDYINLITFFISFFGVGCVFIFSVLTNRPSATDSWPLVFDQVVTCGGIWTLSVIGIYLIGKIIDKRFEIPKTNRVIVETLPEELSDIWNEALDYWTDFYNFSFGEEAEDSYIEIMVEIYDLLLISASLFFCDVELEELETLRKNRLLEFNELLDKLKFSLEKSLKELPKTGLLKKAEMDGIEGMSLESIMDIYDVKMERFH